MRAQNGIILFCFVLEQTDVEVFQGIILEIEEADGNAP